MYVSFRKVTITVELLFVCEDLILSGSRPPTIAIVDCNFVVYSLVPKLLRVAQFCMRNYLRMLAKHIFIDIRSV